MKPSVLHQRDGLQLSYSLGHQTYDAHVYPRQSSNGSTVVIYGNDQGIRVVWYAGKNFKPPKPRAPKVNGNAKDDAMVIDSDDDEAGQSRTASTRAEFEDEDEEVDPAEPYRNVLRHLDIALGSAALRLAVPSIPSDLSDASADDYPPLFRDQLVVAAACSDLSVRLVVLPLLPPSRDLQDESKMDIQIVKLFGRGFHQDLITSISITHTADVIDSAGPAEEARSHSRSRNRPSNADGTHKWALLVASTSCTGSGLLLIHQIPFSGGSRVSSDPEALLPIQRQYLRCPLLSAKLSFNTSLYPSERHSNLLIALPDSASAKVYQVHSLHSFSRARRGSTATTDSVSSTRSSPSSSSRNGKFLITLLPEYASPDSVAFNERRNTVMDAKWILGGRAIIALLENGEWGIWDLEGAGPALSSAKQNLVKGQGSISGIHGGAWTRFALKGSISGSSDMAKHPNAGSASSTGALAPATPHTRKLKAEGLFRGNTEKTSRSKPGNSTGRVYVSPSATNKHDESVVLSYGEQSVYFASILTNWKSEATGTGSFDTSTGGRGVPLPEVRAGDEPISFVGLLPHLPGQASGGLFGTARAFPNFIISTDTRLILFTAPLVEPPAEETSNPASSTNRFGTNLSKEQSLLQHGDLDVDGMDRILEGMNGPTKTNPTFGRSVGFRSDHDDDEMEVSSPTPTKPRLHLGKAKATPRKLFS